MITFSVVSVTINIQQYELVYRLIRLEETFNSLIKLVTKISYFLSWPTVQNKIKRFTCKAKLELISPVFYLTSGPTAYCASKIKRFVLLKKT